MLTLLVMTSDRKIAFNARFAALESRLQEISDDIYMSNSDNRARNGGYLKFVSRKQSDESSPESHDSSPTANIRI